MTRRLKISPTARIEINAIWDYTSARHGENVAQLYVADLDTVMRRLLEFPLLGEDCAEIRSGYRRIRAGDHVIYYIPHDNGVEIMRVMHPKQDAMRRLKG